VRDLETTIEKFARKGIKVLQRDHFVDGGGMAYMGTDAMGGIIMEVVQRPPDYDPEKGPRYASS
jgi:hypothetical protein